MEADLQSSSSQRIWSIVSQASGIASLIFVGEKDT